MPLIKSESHADTFICFISAYSNPNCPVAGFVFITAIKPCAACSACDVLVGKNNLYCDLLLITNELILWVVISSIRFCTCFDIVPNSTSPILAVPAIVLKPSGAKNTTSPASSCMLPPSMQPIFLVTGATAKFAKAVPDNLNILSFPNINKFSLKTLSPTISVSTLIVKNY